jgi:hypothetical protein
MDIKKIFTGREYLLLYVVLQLIAILIYYLFSNYQNNIFVDLVNIFNKYFNLERSNHIKLIIISILPIISYYSMTKLKKD